MASVIVVIHLMVVIALVGTVLLQKSEGGALGIGGGGGGMGVRGQANVLTRATTGLAIAFFTTSMILSMMARGPGEGSILDSANPGGPAVPATSTGPATTEDLLRQFDAQGGQEPSAPQAPISQ
jgi:preprotein translocase subunit SecG